MALKNINLGIGFLLVFAFVSNEVKASNNFCKPRYAANESYYNSSSADEINVIAHAEPDLPAVTITPKQKKQTKSSTNFFTWLTKSHTMPSLHFIEFIELIGDDES